MCSLCVPMLYYVTHSVSLGTFGFSSLADVAKVKFEGTNQVGWGPG